MSMDLNAELASKGIPQEAIDKLQPIILLSGSNEEKIATLKNVLAASETGLHYVPLCRFADLFLHDASLSEEVVDDAIFYLWEHRASGTSSRLPFILIKIVFLLLTIRFLNDTLLTTNKFFMRSSHFL